MAQKTPTPQELIPPAPFHDFEVRLAVPRAADTGDKALFAIAFRENGGVHLRYEMLDEYNKVAVPKEISHSGSAGAIDRKKLADTLCHVPGIAREVASRDDLFRGIDIRQWGAWFPDQSTRNDQWRWRKSFGAPEPDRRQIVALGQLADEARLYFKKDDLPVPQLSQLHCAACTWVLRREGVISTPQMREIFGKLALPARVTEHFFDRSQAMAHCMDESAQPRTR